MKFYDYLCEKEHKNRKLFDVPPYMRGESLLKMMTNAGLFRVRAMQCHIFMNY